MHDQPTCTWCQIPLDRVTLGSTPIVGYRCQSRDESLNQPSFALDLLFCQNCSFACYRHEPALAELINRSYLDQYSTSHGSADQQRQLRDDVARLARRAGIGRGDAVLEIGCNQGKALAEFKTRFSASVIFS